MLIYYITRKQSLKVAKGEEKDMKHISALLSVSLILMMSLPLSGCSEEVKESETAKESEVALESAATEAANDLTPINTHSAPVIKETTIPDQGWQTDAIFPDWQDRTAISSNNRLWFYSYTGQGRIYLDISEDSGPFDLFVNNQKVDTSGLNAGGKYEIDISGISVDGRNTLQLCETDGGSIEVLIPYPSVIEGIPEDVGLSSEALDLIDRIIAADVENGFPAAQLAVVRNGRLVYENAWGNVVTYDENGDPVDSVPVTTDTLFDLASNTKMYSVNYALQYLVTNGQVRVDTKISDILGSRFYEDTIDIAYDGYEHNDLDAVKKWKADLTIEDLLCHQGGFPAGPQYFNDRYDHASQNFDSDNGNILYAGTAGDDSTRSKTLDLICKTPLMYEPGTSTVYSDLDYMILCYCIEEITGERLDDFLKRVFWEPMGLIHITYNPLENGFTPDDCAATELMGNTRDGNVTYTGIRSNTIQGEVHDPLAYYCMAGVSGHAGLFSNAGDLAILASVMLTGGYEGQSYFSRNVIDLFTTPKGQDDPGYALGWWREGDHVRDYYYGATAGTAVYGHQGFTGTLTVIDPENNLVIVLLTNKIHTRLLEGDPTFNNYGGSQYTTGRLGFASEIVHMGLEPDTDPDIWRDLLRSMIKDHEKDMAANGITSPTHPRYRTYEALKSVLDSLG